MYQKRSRKAVRTAEYRTPVGGKRALNAYDYQGLKEEHNLAPPHIMYGACHVAESSLPGVGLFWDKEVAYRCDCGVRQDPGTACSRCGNTNPPEYR